jgi:hypothetical protein
MATLRDDGYWGDGRDPLHPPEGERWEGQVICTRCSWQGDLDDLVVDFSSSRFVAVCPGCATGQEGGVS